MPNPWKIETQAGEAIHIGAHTVVPFAKTWQLTSKTGNGGVIWSRPASVLVQSADGQEQVVSIPDLTLRIIVSLFGVCLGASLLMFVISLIRRR